MIGIKNVLVQNIGIFLLGRGLKWDDKVQHTI